LAEEIPDMTKPKTASGAQVSFRASIPPTEQAIKIAGDGGARMILDIAESDLAGFLPALVFRGKRLMISIREDDA
jgi:hypothetical protein